MRLAVVVSWAPQHNCYVAHLSGGLDDGALLAAAATEEAARRHGLAILKTPAFKRRGDR